MTAPTYYGLTRDQWRRAKEEMLEILRDVARRKTTIYYSVLVNRLKTVRWDPNSLALGAMLGEISEDESVAKRGMLSVVVVHKDGDMMPGPGFFDLANRLGRDTSDKEKCWIQELNLVYAANAK